MLPKQAHISSLSLWLPEDQNFRDIILIQVSSIMPQTCKNSKKHSKTINQKERRLFLRDHSNKNIGRYLPEHVSSNTSSKRRQHLLI